MSDEPVTVLAVASVAVLEQLRRILSHSRWNLMEAATVEESRVILRSRSSVVVVCDAVLPDGGWRELLRQTRRYSIPPPLIVAADHADELLWMEVLNRGAYNLIAKPLQHREVFQVVGRAWLYLRQSTGKSFTA